MTEPTTNAPVPEPAVTDDAAPDDRSASRALLGRGSVYTIATAFQLAGALLAQAPLTRLLPVDEYGIASVGVVITATLGLILGLGLPAIVTREYFRGGADTAGAVIALSAFVTVLLDGLAFATGPLWAHELGGFTAPLMIGTVTAVSYSIIVTCQAVQRARNEIGRFVFVVALNVVGGQIAGLAATYWFSRTATAYLLGVAGGSVVGAAISLVWAKPSVRGLRDRAAIRSWFAIALPTVPHIGALYLMTAGDRYVVLALLGKTGAAEYNVAYLIGALGITLVAATNNAWAPLIYATPDDRRWEVLAITTQDMLRVAAITAAGVAVAAPLGLWIMADGKRYDIAALTPMVALTALATVPYVLYLASVHVLMWRGRTAALMWITPLAVSLNLGAKYLVLPHFKYTGAAVVTVGAYALLAVLVGHQRRKEADVPFRRRWPEIAGATVLCVVGAELPFGPVWYAVRALLALVLVGLLVLVARHLMADRKLATAD